MRLRSLRPITPAGRHTAFGYYDRCAWDAEGRWHLGIEMPQQDTLPRPEERATVLAIDTVDGDRALALGTTAAWNHQFAAMTTWLPDRSVLFNDREGERVFSRVVDLGGRELRRLSRPIYQLSPDGRMASSMDFARIQRRGYSYAIANPRETGGDPLPSDDGLWLVDTVSGATRLLASYVDMAAVHPEPDDLGGRFVWINCPMFNRDGSRLLWVFRYIPEDGRGWKTFLYTIGVDGSELRCALPHTYWQTGAISHMEWGREPDEILVDADLRGRGGEFTVFRDDGRPPRFSVLAPGVTIHGHQYFSPDRRWIVSDTYPIDGHQILIVVEAATGRTVELARMRHGPLPGGNVDLRCDLHPRWRGDGRALSVDSIHDGCRRIYLLELEE
jgi:hypothetical protein